MNTTSYILARAALSFGIHRKNKRLAEAAEEMHLLRQAEEILGEDVWEEVEDVEDISVEYWSVRKLLRNREKLSLAVKEADSILNISHEERNAILAETNQAVLSLEKKRDSLIEHSEQLIAERDQVISEAQQIRRKFDAARTKVQVLSEEEGNEQIIKAERTKLAAYKEDFSSLKQRRDAVGKKIAELDVRISEIEAIIAEDRKKLRASASNAYQSIGKANRDVSNLTAEIGIIDLELKDHFTEIGRYVSTNTGSDDTCRKLCRKYSNLYAQMQSLRTSIALNHKLASLAGA